MVKLVKNANKGVCLINSKNGTKVRLKLIAVVITLGTVLVTISGFNFERKIILFNQIANTIFDNIFCIA